MNLAATPATALAATRRWRRAAWGLAAAMMAVPALAKLFSPGMGWDGADFVLFAAMLGTVLAGLELALRASGQGAYRAGAALALGTGFLLVWVNAAVGLIGDVNNPANRLFIAVLAVAALGAAASRLQAAGLARTLVATALAQAAVAAVAAAAGWGHGLVATLVFCPLWLGAAALFRRAARNAAAAAAAPASSTAA